MDDGKIAEIWEKQGKEGLDKFIQSMREITKDDPIFKKWNKRNTGKG